MSPGAELPATMRAAVYRGRREIVVNDRRLPDLGPRDALVQVSHCGVCGTDLHMVLEGWGRPGSVPGHEYAGRIVALGPDVTSWALGEPVVGGPRESCGHCVHCDAGRPSLCAARADIAGEDGPDGAFAEYVRVHESQLLRLPEGLSLRVAALAEPLAVALHALTRGAISEGAPAQRVLVTGAGPLGLLTVAALAARGVQEIRVSEPAAGRRERAARVGATETCTPGDLVAPVMPYALVDDPVDVAFECSGHPEAMEGALGQLGRAGTLVLVGTGMKRPRLDHNRILLNELVVTGAYTYDEDGMADAIALLGSGRLPTDWLIEPQDVPLEGMLAAMERLATGEIPAKVMVIPGTR